MLHFKNLLLATAFVASVLASPAPNPFEPTPVLKKRFATNTIPASKGYSALSTPKVVTGTFDGGMVRYDRGGRDCLFSVTLACFIDHQQCLARATLKAVKPMLS